jgi:hypothetical protein
MARQCRLEAEQKSALRDSRLLTLMVGNDDNVELIRAITYLIHEHPNWNTVPEERIGLALKIHSFLVNADDVFEGQTK